MAVRQPIRYPTILSKRVTRLLILSVWAISGLIALCLFILETLHSSPNYECSPMKLPSLYIIFSAMASFFVPVVIMGTYAELSMWGRVLTTSMPISPEDIGWSYY
ncbi:hypothetical protein KIN20_017556 [Parelaphostrongylus tenuis]|uniref:G-protein coupled receptors family 1 profile domain-containing protein n=1 Tax=Parelaphostrongylus tenuis TaxID=148309 RepID=A0AAD5N386_PARTN|nr:hypothetical protein KIN20_017556 [Parelaphostrongylus tenuis]